MRTSTRACATLATLIGTSSMWASRASAEEIFVGPGEAHTTIQSALDAAASGDVITVRAGTYDGALTTRASGVTLRADAGAVVIAAASGRVLDVEHPRFVVEGVVFDGALGASDAIVAEEAASELVLRDVEVRNAGRDCIDLRGRIADVTIEDSLIHHCLWSSAPDCDADACREDAHGVVADQAQRLTIRRTEIHTFSGDALQMNGRDQPTIWDDVRIEGCTFWTAALPVATGGFAAGVVPGENAIDTKTPDTDLPAARITILDTVAHGFRGGLITNMAAYNMKENVLVTFERVSIHDSEIAFRLRGGGDSRPRGAQVTIRNAVVWDADTAVRYEDDITTVRIECTTIGGDVTTPFRAASAPSGVISAANLLVLAAALPGDAAGASNLAVDGSAFVDAAAHDYHLADGSPAIDSGETLASVAVDRDAIARPQGADYDIGAYEHCGASCAAVDAGTPVGSDGGGVPGADGGEIDAGPTSRVDAGPTLRVDGGGSVGSDPGCGCRANGAGGSAPLRLGAMLALLVIACRRRKR
jgi:hypothetical protein